MSEKNIENELSELRFACTEIEQRMTTLEMENNVIRALAAEGQLKPLPEVDEDVNPNRGQWGGRFEFFLSSLGFAVGLGNLWRFPYLCAKHGGGAFLIPYLTMLFLVGMPLVFLEMSLGQFVSLSSSSCWDWAPILKGIGIYQMFVSAMVVYYYNAIIGWALYYLFVSMQDPLPWDKNLTGTSEANRHLLNQSQAQQFYARKIQQVAYKGASFTHLGPPSWELVITIFVAWTLLWLFTMRGIQTSGKVVYFTALFPYALLVILFFQCLKPGYKDGWRYYLTPNFKKIFSEFGVWREAANQIFFSLSATMGGMISLASFNKFHHNVLREAVVVTLLNSCSSLFIGFVVFGFTGVLARNLNVPVEEVTRNSFELVFVVYPEAVKTFGFPPLWSVLFFFMVFLLGVDSAMTLCESVITGLCDTFPQVKPFKFYLNSGFCLSCALLGIVFATPGGQDLLGEIDSGCNSWNCYLVGIMETVAITYLYSGFRFTNDIGLMVQQKYYWKYTKWIWLVCWGGVTPIILFVMWISLGLQWKQKETKRLVFEMVITMIITCPILFRAIVVVYQAPCDNLWHKFVYTTKPAKRWGPSMKVHRRKVSHAGYVDDFAVSLNDSDCIDGGAFSDKAMIGSVFSDKAMIGSVTVVSDADTDNKIPHRSD